MLQASALYSVDLVGINSAICDCFWLFPPAPSVVGSLEAELRQKTQ